ncbi:MAG TPA: class I SAM-dependent methyltransferase [Ktedonobacterales bacterium]|nr:class I SAM-dependent methyltransferase [Ktedonobacterales bacterium]
MNHDDHVHLIQDGITGPGVWADLGSGWGAFTLALADLLGPGSSIYSVDKDRGALRDQERAMRSRFPDVDVHYLAADFTRPLDLPPLDGVVMANSLHFQRDKEAVLQRVRGYLKPGGRLVLVEYNTDHGNPWVPYPLSYATWEALARRAGFATTRLLATRGGGRHNDMYASLSM